MGRHNLSIDELIKTKEIYVRVGTLEAVGKEMGITREAIRLRLLNYKKYFNEYYTPKHKIKANLISTMNKDQIILDFLQTGYQNTKAFLEINNIKLSVPSFQKAFNIPTEVLYESHKLWSMNKTISDYKNLSLVLGYNPKSTFLQKYHRNLWTKIPYYWESFSKFLENVNGG